MNYTTVYEINSSHGISIPFIILVLGFISILGYIISTWHKKARFLDKIGPYIADFILLMIIIVTIFDGVNTSFNIYDKYKTDNYQIVEGVIEEFHPMPPELHDTEHFEVNRIYFYYPDFSGYGYSLCKKDGGFIRENGQQVRIRYVTYMGRNIIMKLEIILEE